MPKLQNTIVEVTVPANTYAADWETKSLGEVCSLISRGISPKYLDNGGIRVLNQRCIRNHEIDWSVSRRHNDKEKRVASDRFLQLGDGLINSTGTGTLGRVVQVVSPLEEPTTVDSHVTIVRPKPGLFNPKFFGYMLIEIEDQLKDSGEGCGGQTELARNTVAEQFMVRFPSSIKEQERIVAMLDKTFEWIAKAAANAEQSLNNAQALFENYLQFAVNQRRSSWRGRTLAEISREFGRGKSKHRPRNAPQLYEGPYPFVQTGDISNANHWITSYKQTYSEVGLAQSRLWPKGTVCIAIVGATVGETAILNFAACFPDSVIGVVVNEQLADNEYVEYLLQAFKSLLKEKGKGTARDNINLGTFEDHEFPFPPLSQQKEIVATINALSKQIGFLSSVCQKRITALEELKQSLLNQAFSGQLLKQTSQAVVIPFPITLPNISSTDLHVGILSIAYAAHERAHKASDFGHVKAEKIAHMVEAYVGVNLGRTPVRDAAGPNDFPHLKKVEHRASKAGYLTFARQASGGYRVTKKAGFDSLITKTRAALGDRNQKLIELLDLMTPMTTKQAEIFATVYAAWNNLLMDGAPSTDEHIVRAAREDWHSDKLSIPRDKFFTAIEWMRTKDLCPGGKGKRVERKSSNH